MSIRTISATLNLDTAQFSMSVKDSSGKIKTLKQDVEELNRAVTATASALDGSVRAARIYAATNATIAQSHEAMKKAQDGFVAGLVKELETMGMSSTALKYYQAQKLGLTEQTKALIEAIDKEQRALMSKAQAEREAASASADALRVQKERQNSAEFLVRSLQDEITVLKYGTDALALQRAEELGVADATRLLLEEKQKIIAASKAETEALTGAARQKKADRDASAAMAATEAKVRRDAEAMLWAVDGTTAALRRKTEALKTADAAERMGIFTTEQRIKAEQHATDEYERYVKSQAKGGGLKNHQLTNLSYQANDVISGIAMGQPLGMIAAQQTGQIFQILQQGSGGVMGSLKGLTSALAALAPEIIVVSALLGEFSAVFIAIGKRDETLRTVREFNALLTVTADSAGTTGTKLTELAQRLDTYGTTLKGAKTEIQTFLKEGINPERMEEFGETAEHMSKVLGIDVPTAAAEAAKAFTGGWHEVRQLDQSLNFLTLTEAKHIKALFDSGKAGEARNEAFRIFSEKYAKAYNDSVGEGVRLTQTMGESWNDLIGNLSNTKSIEGATNVIGDLVRGMNDWLTAGMKISSMSRGTLINEQDRLGGELADLNKRRAKGMTSADWWTTARIDRDPKTGRPVTSEQQWNINLDKEEKELLSRASQVQRRLSPTEKMNYGTTASTGSVTPIMSKDAEGKLALDKKDKKPTTGRDESALTSLKAESASLNESLKDGQTTWAKYKSMLDDSTSSLAKAVGGNKAMREEILAQAAAVDELKKQLEAKKAYDNLVDESKKQAQALKDTQAEYARVTSGVDAATMANQRYAASLLKNVEEAGKYKTPTGAKTPQEIAAQAASDQAETRRIEKAGQDYDSLKKKLSEGQVKTQSFWDDYASGINKADTGLASLKATLDALVKTQAPDMQGQAQTMVDQILKDYQSGETAKALLDMRDQTKAINRDLMTDSYAKARAITQEEIDQAHERIKWASLTAEEQKAAYADYQAFVEAKNKELQSHSRFGQLSKEWGDAMSNMKDASTGWAESFAKDLSQGKLNVGDFAASVIADIAEIVTKAILAKYVIDPLLNAFGLGSVSATGSSAASSAMSAGQASMASIGASAIQLHDGGVGTEGAHRLVDPRWFVNAPKFHAGKMPDLMPHEMAAVIRKDEGVFTPEQMKAMGTRMSSNTGGSGSAPQVTVNLNNQSGSNLDADHSGTKFDGEKYILDVVVSNLGKPGTFRNAVRNNK